MLASMMLRGIGVIDEAEIEFGPGLTVITGETGAGKTMLLTGLGLLLGGRTDAAVVRAGMAAAQAEGRFVGPSFPGDVTAVLEDAGARLDEDGSLIVARSVSGEGRSRAHIGGRAVPAATLAEVGAHLVAVHGQDDQHRLLQPAQQRQALDRYGGPDLRVAAGAYATTYDQLLAVTRELADIREHRAARAREAADLADLLDLIDRVSPVAGEEAALRAEAERLAHVDELVSASDAAMTAVHADGDGAIDRVGRAVDCLMRAAERDPELASLARRLHDVQTDLTEAAVDIGRYQAGLDADPGRLAAVEERRAALTALRRRLDRQGIPAEDGLAAWAEEARARLAGLGDDDALEQRLEADRERLAGEAARLAEEVGALRQTAAERLAGAVTAELAALAMPKASLEVALSLRPPRAGQVTLLIGGQEAAADRHGVHEVEFRLVPRPSAPARPLGKGASGGERSRIMLALEVVFAGLDPVPTFVFDEVDAGVGGKAALEVGRRLSRLSRESQVIVVTHLPQVACFADRHVVVRPGGAVTSSDVLEVRDSERVRELARMMTGQDDSASALAHAAELLESAAEEARDTPDTRGRGARSRRTVREPSAR